MPETEYECVTKEWLQVELRATSTANTASATSISKLSSSSLLSGVSTADSGCSGNNDLDSKDLIILDCRSSHEYSESHIRSAVNFSIPSIMLRRLAAGKIDLLSTIKSPELKEQIQNGYKESRFILYNDVGLQPQQQQSDVASGSNGGGGSVSSGLLDSSDSTINVLHRRLKQDGCRVASLQDVILKMCPAFEELEEIFGYR